MSESSVNKPMYRNCVGGLVRSHNIENWTNPDLLKMDRQFSSIVRTINKSIISQLWCMALLLSEWRYWSLFVPTRPKRTRIFDHDCCSSHGGWPPIGHPIVTQWATLIPIVYSYTHTIHQFHLLPIASGQYRPIDGKHNAMQSDSDLYACMR